MKQITLFFIITLLSVSLFSCQKAERLLIENQSFYVEKEVVVKFFALNKNTNLIVQRVANDIKRRNESTPFVSDFVKTNGFPVWEQALVVINGDKVTEVYIPLVRAKTRFTSGFIRAVIDEDIVISSFRSSEYAKYPFTNGDAFSADNFASFIMYFDYKIFGHDRFILKDKRLFSSILFGKGWSERREVKIQHIDRNIPATRITNCYLVTENIAWLEADPENCTCINKAECDWATGCTDCSNQFSTSMSYWSGNCGGSGGVVWNPAPPPGGGGSDIIASSSLGWVPYPDSQEYQYFVTYTLTPNQQAYWNNPNNAGFVSPLIQKLVSGNYSDESQFSVQYWLNYLMSGTDITSQEFQNYFMSAPEGGLGGDGVYNASYWDDPNLTFQQATLPSLSAYRSAFPKIVDPNGTIGPMDNYDVYTLVGGEMNIKNKSGHPNYYNACAIRGSRGLNYCGMPIDPSIPDVITELGGDGKRYILSAKAFNRYMNIKFDAPPSTHRLTKAQIAGNPEKVKMFLRGKNGIYTLVYSGGSVTGHVDLILNGICLGTTGIGDLSNVEKIEIWELK